MSVKLVSLSGSLRAQSSNSRLLRAAQFLLPTGVTLVPCERLGTLPHFNQDLDTESPPDSVRLFRDELRAGQGFVISSPEYAHGMPGTLKNGLDWIVSSGEISRKPILLINASAGGSEFAQAQLTEVLTVMEGVMLPRVTLSGPQLRQAFGADGKIIDAEISAIIEKALAQLVQSL